MKRKNFIKSAVALLAVPALSFKNNTIHDYLVSKNFECVVDEPNYKRYVIYDILSDSSKKLGIKFYTWSVSINLKRVCLSKGHGLYSMPCFVGEVNTVEEMDKIFKMTKFCEESSK